MTEENKDNQKKEANKDDNSFINIDFGESIKLSEALVILTLLPTRGFILAIFTLIVLIATPPVLKTFPEGGWWRVGGFCGISFVVGCSGYFLWRTGNEYNQCKKLVNTIRNREKNINETTERLREGYLLLQDVSSQSSEIKFELNKLYESFKENPDAHNQEKSNSTLKLLKEILVKTESNIKKAESLEEIINDLKIIPSDFIIEDIVKQRDNQEEKRLDKEYFKKWEEELDE